MFGFDTVAVRLLDTANPALAESAVLNQGRNLDLMKRLIIYMHWYSVRNSRLHSSATVSDKAVVLMPARKGTKPDIPS